MAAILGCAHLIYGKDRLDTIQHLPLLDDLEAVFWIQPVQLVRAVRGHQQVAICSEAPAIVQWCCEGANLCAKTKRSAMSSFCL
jgi:hypothetical protein